MSRWRPAAEKSTAIISRAGFDRLKAELDHLWRVERPEVTAVVTAAAKNGDRSENGDYIYGKRRLGEIDRRVRYLRRRLDEFKIVEQPPSDPSRIFFGALVTLTNDQNQNLRVRIVGPDEIDPSKQHISIDSPLARAILGKAQGDEARFDIPGGQGYWVIESVSYQQIAQ